MIDKIEELLKEVETLQAADAKEAEALRIKYLGKKGIINDLMADFRNVPADQKKEVGMKLNELKNKAQEKINALKEAASAQDHLADDLDLTRTAYPSRWAHAIRSPSSRMKSWTSSRAWDSRWPKAPKWKTTGTCIPP